MKLISLLALLLTHFSALAQYDRRSVIATPPQGRYIRVPSNQYSQQPQQGYVQPGYAQPDEAEEENGYQQPQCSNHNPGYQPPEQNLNPLHQACGAWENNQYRRAGQLADMTIRIICRQTVTITARVEAKGMNAYEVKSGVSQNGEPWVKTVSCKQVAEAQYDIARLCMQQPNEQYGK